MSFRPDPSASAAADDVQVDAQTWLDAVLAADQRSNLQRLELTFFDGSYFQMYWPEPPRRRRQTRGGRNGR